MVWEFVVVLSSRSRPSDIWRSECSLCNNIRHNVSYIDAKLNPYRMGAHADGQSHCHFCKVIGPNCLEPTEWMTGTLDRGTGRKILHNRHYAC